MTAVTPPAPCRECATPLDPAAPWCWLCLAPRLPGAGTAAGFRDARPAPVAGAVPLPAVRGSRWRRTAITYGPVGRVCWTVGLLAPVVLFVHVIAVGGLEGLVAYGGVILPWALRDVWHRVR